MAITFVTDTSTAAAGSSYSYQPPADDDYDDSYGEFNRERKAAAVARHQGHEATALLDVIRTTVELLKASKESYEVACARPSAVAGRWRERLFGERLVAVGDVSGPGAGDGGPDARV